MKKSTWKLFLVALFPLVLLMVGLLGFTRTPGFGIQKIRSPFIPHPEWETAALSVEERSQVDAIFSQKFYYLASGAESYAFVSEDGKSVLKFFKMKHLIPKTWLKYFPLPGLKHYRFLKTDRRQARCQALFGNYKAAYEELKEETGLITVHLNKTRDLYYSVILVDRAGREYRADLDNLEFVLQKRAELIYDRVAQLMQKGDVAGAENALRAVLHVVETRSQKGYRDCDGGVSRNYGFVGDEPIHIDVGRWKREEAAPHPSEVVRVRQKMQKWVEANYSELMSSSLFSACADSSG
jgi:hypothetical protein